MDYLNEFNSVFNNYKTNLLPLSYGQYDIWIEQQLYPEDISNHSHFVTKIEGEVNLELFQKALHKLFERHEILRTIFPIIKGIPVRKILLNETNFSFEECLNFSFEAIKQKIANAYAKPFNLLVEMPYRFCLYKQSNSDYYLQIVEHHIAVTMDAYIDIPIELAKLYTAEKNQKKPDLKDIASTYSDFVHHNYEEFNSSRFKTDREYWKNYLAGDFFKPKLPLIEQSNQNIKFSIKSYQSSIDNELILKLQTIAKIHNVTIFSVLTTCFQLLLYKYTHQNEIIVGIPCDTRRGIYKEVIGYTANTLPLKCIFETHTEFILAVKSVNSDIRNMLRHRHYPLRKIMEDLRSERRNDISELFNVLVISQKADNFKEIALSGIGRNHVNINIDGLQYTSIGIGYMSTGRFNLALAIVETPEEHVLSFHYNGCIFDDKAIQRLASNYLTMLQSIASDPHKKIKDLEIVSEEEKKLQTQMWNDTGQIVNFDFLDSFEKCASLYPEATAVVFEGKELSYESLNNLANQLAHSLQKEGASVETLIGIAVKRSFNLIIAQLAVIKAGSAYLPLDPSYPKERLQFILEDSQAHILITDDSLDMDLKDFKGKIIKIEKECLSEGKNNLIKNSNQKRLAYVIYTSGSTGKPKGVEITHKALNNFLCAMQQQLNLSHKDRFLAITTTSFDISNLEILLPLSQAAAVVLVSEEASKDPSLLSDLIEKEKVTFAQATPSRWQMLVDFGWRGKPDLTLLSGGEELSSTLAAQLFGLSKALWNMYGPTETTIWSSMKRIEGPDQKITIGRPIANTTFHVLDENQSLVPIGVPAELYIGGFGLARGYRNRPDLTKERFVFHLGERLYRTGDLVSYVDNGELSYLGRIDHQVKIHGYRIELGEIEASIKKCPEVQQVVVVAREDRPKDKLLVAYYTGNATQQQIKHLLHSHLPHYMIPTAFVQLAHFPFTPNGKIDRKLLPAPHFRAEIDCKKPSNAYEKQVIRIFEEVLAIKDISVDAHFFSLGGHSLSAAQIITKINRAFYIQLPLRMLFEKPTAELLAKAVEQTVNSGKKDYSPIVQVPRQQTFDLSFSQQRFWFLDQQTTNGALYSIPFVLHMHGVLDLAILQKAIKVIAQRHEILRSVFEEGVDIKQHILAKNRVMIRYKDMRSCENPQQTADSFLLKEANKAFNLNKGPLFRFYLIQIEDTEFLLFLNIHHIIFDGYSTHLFLKELKTIYEAYKAGKPHALEDLLIQYRDYIYWQKAQVENLKETHLSWWMEKLNNAPQVLNLPIDKPRPNIQTYRGSIVDSLIADPALVDSLKQLSQKQDCTLFVFLLTLFHILLYRYTSQNDFIVGVPTSSRDHIGLDFLIGSFVNTLPLRTTSFSQDSFIDLLKKIKEETLQAFDHQDIPFEMIIEKLKIERSLSQSSLFQVMFTMLPELSIKKIDDLEVSLQNVDRGMSHFDLSLSLQETEKGLMATFEYSTDLFRRNTIERMSSHFKKLLESVVENPDQKISSVPMLLDEELERQVVDWNKQEIPYPKENIIVCFEKQVLSTPDAKAVICGDTSYSYFELNAQANRIAHQLLKRGIQTENKVAVCLERSAEFIVAILGILKAGGAYIPLDPNQPKDRIQAILEELQPFCILTHSHLGSFYNNSLYIDQISSCDDSNPLVPISENQLAYIIYTSGSTGKPKGVEIEHESISDRVFWKNAAYPLTSQDVMLHTYSFIFDGAIINYFWPLCTGASLVIATKSEQIDAQGLIRLIQKYQVTSTDLLPSLLEGLLEEKEMALCSSLKTVFSGGEALANTIVKLFYKRCPWAKLHNTYGPTEATVEASVWECKQNYEGAVAPIGKPIAGAKLYILDPQKNIVPVGVHGELYIGGVGLARGYFNDQTLTNEKFIKNPFNPNERLYRTGDLVKYNDDGNIEFLGRIDNQVKIRGYRIDLGEIESALLHMDPVEKAIVRVIGTDLHKQLVAYVILRLDMQEQAFKKLMKHYLSEKLPDYMIPQQVMVVQSFPTLPNGKINYKQLPAISYKIQSIAKVASNDVENKLLNIWKEILKLEAIDLADNFFEIGGNSLLAMRVVARIKSLMNISVPLIQMFQFPTIETLAESIGSITKERVWSPIVLMKSGGEKEPFFFVHPVGGGILCYTSLAKHWSADRPLYAIQAKGLEEGETPIDSIEEMAKEYIKSILTIQPTGPYFLGGWSFGGLVAVEMARQLLEQAREVVRLILIDTSSDLEMIKNVDANDESILLKELTNHLVAEPKAKRSSLSFKEQFARFIENGGSASLRSQKKGAIDRVVDLAKANYKALQKFSIPVLKTDIILLKSKLGPKTNKDYGWNSYTNNLIIRDAPGDHWAITKKETAPEYANIIENVLDH